MISPFFLLLFLFLLYMSVLYKSSSSLALCLLFLFWAAASVFQLLYSRKKVQVDFPFSAHTGAKESQAVFTFTVKNQGVLPVSGIRLRLLLLHQKGRRKKDFPLSWAQKPSKIFSDFFFSLLWKIPDTIKKSPDLQLLISCMAACKNPPDGGSCLLSPAFSSSP